MAFLKAARKVDLQDVAQFLELSFDETETRDALIEKILAKPGYDQNILKEIYQDCKAARQEEARRIAEKEKFEMELAARRLSEGMANVGVNERSSPNTDLSKVLGKFDPKRGDIGLYLVNFERQAKLHRIPESMWVSHLLGLVTTEMSQIIAREEEDKAHDYLHVRKVLLGRFKLNPERFRQKFFGGAKQPDQLWIDFAFEMETNLEEWIHGLGVKSFEELKKLMVVEQIRRKLPNHVKEHFLDSLGEVKSPEQLANMVDAYESKREEHGIHFSRYNRPNPARESPEKGTSGKEASSKMLTEKIHSTEKATAKDGTGTQSNFERPWTRKCYVCQQAGHLSYNCPWRDGPEATVSQISDEF